MENFDDVNRLLNLTPMTPSEMNSIHFETGQHTPVDLAG